MSKYTPEQLLEFYKKLPKDLQEAIINIDTPGIIQAIGKKYNLPIDKTGELADETGLVMLGLTHPNNFISNLTQRLDTDKETARKIGEEINNQIFAKVRESLKKVHEINPTPEIVPAKEEILKEIEKDETKEEVPGILKGATQTTVFEAKTKEEVLRIPPEEKKYSGGDPYREPIE
jgi:hypothetical protein